LAAGSPDRLTEERQFSSPAPGRADPQTAQPPSWASRPSGFPRRAGFANGDHHWRKTRRFARKATHRP
jgi:hypothetical protein